MVCVMRAWRRARRVGELRSGSTVVVVTGVEGARAEGAGAAGAGDSGAGG